MNRRATWLWITIAFLLLLLAFVWSPARAETGLASWYGSESGSRRADGHRFNPEGLTVAHRHHPFGTKLKIARIDTGAWVICIVRDRGPALWTGRIVDLAKGCARKLKMLGIGVVRVRLTVVR